ncbi:unnamed protein product [Mycena citricolor]|uniref:Carboxylic ester hydrolase n=1 Tax=Mycena citricolor TaxID=2018698 RepID=A0AAD2H0J0_9AGAR|nr:unnamed protein product [Mycena citricolor]CAK5266976.1 unnamed protein product [Mycena citricolor]
MRQSSLPLLLVSFALAAASTPTSEVVDSDLTLLFQNDLDWRTTSEHDSFILLSPRTHTQASTACAQLNENLTPTNGTFFSSDVPALLSYTAYSQKKSKTQKYWVAGSSASCTTISPAGLQTTPCSQKLPVLCKNSAPNRISGQTDLSSTWQVNVKAGDLSVTGTRDHVSFRFLGIPFANPTQRWTYSSLYTGPSEITALEMGSPCAQNGGTGAEDCLFLNVFTPFIPAKPKQSSTALKPVMFWIHGGGFTNGEASSADKDGGSLASRGDVVLVSVNYRLGALGFLALDDGVTNGNYGLADMITALKWVQKYISAFGGDPNRITIFGQSAGAGAVRALLGSPPAFGLFSGAIAQSNLAGVSYAKTYSDYYTIEQEVAVAASAFVSEMGCANATANATLTCLRAVSWQTLQNAPDAPRYLVVDGHYLVRDRLSVDGKGPIAPNVHVMFGWMADDGTDFAGGYPAPGESQLSSVEAIGLTANTSSAILASGQFPTYTSGNATLDVLNVTSRIATDGEFSCLDQATLHSAALHKVFKSVWAYQFDRSYMGYEPIPGVCDPPATAAHPFGDPSLPYFKCHSGDLYLVFGNIGQSTPGFPFRDAFDLPFEQLALDSWTSFARTHDPNPDSAFLDARAFAGTKNALAQWGSWLPVQSAKPVRILDWPSRSSGWLEQKQCAVLGFPLDYYE